MSHGKRIGSAAARAAALAWATPARAQGSAGTAGQGTGSQQGTQAQMGGAASGGQLTTKEKDALAKLHAANQGEVKLAQLAEQTSQSQAVKDFAQRMVTDHQQNDEQLQQLAQSMGVPLEGKAFQKEQEAAQKSMKQLQSKQGADFDKAYMSLMTKDHEKDAKALDGAAKAAQKNNPQLAAFLEQTRDTVKSHLAEAKQVEAQVKGGKGHAQAGSTGMGGSGSTSGSSAGSSGQGNGASGSPGTGAAGSSTTGPSGQSGAGPGQNEGSLK